MIDEEQGPDHDHTMPPQHPPNTLQLELHANQLHALPSEGRRFVAQADQDVVVVYQAYKPSIAGPAASAQRLTASPDFSEGRMTWVKPGFLWMMYRSGWASKEHQEHILAITLHRSWLMDALRSNAVLSTPANAGICKTKDIVVQWDPDHSWDGAKLARRAIQIGLRGEVARAFAAGVEGPAVAAIEDITPFVVEMREQVVAGGTGAVMEGLWVPKERVLEVDATLQSLLEM